MIDHPLSTQVLPWIANHTDNYIQFPPNKTELSLIYVDLPFYDYLDIGSQSIQFWFKLKFMKKIVQ